MDFSGSGSGSRRGSGVGSGNGSGGGSRTDGGRWLVYLTLGICLSGECGCMRRRLRGSAASRESRARSRRLALLRSTKWIGIGGIEFESVCTVHWPRHAITHAKHRRGGGRGGFACAQTCDEMRLSRLWSVTTSRNVQQVLPLMVCHGPRTCLVQGSALIFYTVPRTSREANRSKR